MSRYRLAAAALFVVSLVLLSGCGGGVSRREVLADLTDHVITPRFASTQRGLNALEYRLFQDDDRLLRELGEPSSRFGEYLRSLTADIAEETAGVRDAWSGADGDQFAGRGDRVIAESLAIADLVRVTIFLTATAEAAQTGQADPAARGARPGWSRSTDASGAGAGAGGDRARGRLRPGRGPAQAPALSGLGALERGGLPLRLAGAAD